MKYYARWNGNVSEIYAHCENENGLSSALVTAECSEEQVEQIKVEPLTLTLAEIEQLDDIVSIDSNEYDAIIEDLNSWARIGTRPPRPYIPGA